MIGYLLVLKDFLWNYDHLPQFDVYDQNMTPDTESECCHTKWNLSTPLLMVAWKYGIKLNKKHDSLNSEDSIDPKKYSFAQFKLPIGHTIYIVLVMMITKRPKDNTCTESECCNTKWNPSTPLLMVAWKYGIKLNNDSLSDIKLNSMDQKNYSFAHFKLPIGHTLNSISNDDNYCEYDSRWTKQFFPYIWW